MMEHVQGVWYIDSVNIHSVNFYSLQSMSARDSLPLYLSKMLIAVKLPLDPPNVSNIIKVF